MTGARRIRHVDAFTSTPLEGNPAAVVDGDGDGLDTETMQRIALNQRLSETVFLFPPESPENDAKLRIFTPGVEVPFAGHPTIAAAHILSSERFAGSNDHKTLHLETGAGEIPVDVGDGPLYTMNQVPPVIEPAKYSNEKIASCVGLDPADILRAGRVSTGLFWLVAQVASLEAMLRVRPDMFALAALTDGLSIFCLGAQSADGDIHVRTFAPAFGVPEDPVTGSSNGCIAAFIATNGIIEATGGEIAYVSEQGIEMGQPGRVYLRVTGLPDAPSVYVGGHAVTVLRGDLTLSA